LLGLLKFRQCTPGAIFSCRGIIDFVLGAEKNGVGRREEWRRQPGRREDLAPREKGEHRILAEKN
jgi:hypothetical protein